MSTQTRQTTTDSRPPASATQPNELLQALLAMRDGDFSVRLPGDWTGLDGKIADTFNEIVVRQRAHLAGTGTGRPLGRTRGPDPSARQVRPLAGFLGPDGVVGQYPD